MEQITELAGPVLQFKTRAEKVGAKVLVAANLAEAVALIAQTIAEGERGSIVVPSSLLAQEPIFKSTFQENLQEATSTAIITGAVAGISPGEFGICETGSVVYAVNDPLERQVAMLSVVHFALLYADRLVPDLDTAGVRLKELQTREGRRYVSFVTGPSRTADIERVLTIGVQGPKALYVVLINQRD